ncbi:hypothetical protein, partial [Rhodococcus opacus]|uniref:hypothetical protein n=1 Tax=Rhodococcus opacus TaxID=37919 RepID=UPI001C48C3D8
TARDGMVTTPPFATGTRMRWTDHRRRKQGSRRDPGYQLRWCGDGKGAHRRVRAVPRTVATYSRMA